MRAPLASWQKILSKGFSSTVDLLNFLNLPVDALAYAAEKTFKTRVPLSFAARMQTGNIDDPLLLQVLASVEELVSVAGFVSDPLEEKLFNPIPGLIHKYNSRVLLTVTGGCAINCRYCFRRHFSYQKNNPQREGWGQIINYIGQDPNITEVILSGGDPLLAKDHQLLELFNLLREIPHIRTLRIHSRIPVVLPERVDDDFLAMFASLPWHKVIVLHTNHAQELDESVKEVCEKLRAINCHLLSQSVLLKKVNDNVHALEQLSIRLFDCGVLPYYLHLLDKVHGAAHFDVAFETALEIYSSLQTKLPGYLLPRLVREEANKKHKTLVNLR